jgi:hypothetical protein
VVLQGIFDLHGVQRQVTMEAMVAFEGPRNRLTTDFPVNLEDYAIGGLSKMLGMLKMSKMITVHVDVVFEPEEAMGAVRPGASEL